MRKIDWQRIKEILAWLLDCIQAYPPPTLDDEQTEADTNSSSSDDSLFDDYIRPDKDAESEDSK